jgi:hypothetical protein
MSKERATPAAGSKGENKSAARVQGLGMSNWSEPSRTPKVRPPCGPNFLRLLGWICFERGLWAPSPGQHCSWPSALLLANLTVADRGNLTTPTVKERRWNIHEFSGRRIQAAHNRILDAQTYVLTGAKSTATYDIYLSYMLVLFRIIIFNIFKYFKSMSLICIKLQHALGWSRWIT